MRVGGRFPNSPARATTVLGLEPFRGTADGGVLALSFVTALLARPWKVGVPCQDHLRECSRRAAAQRPEYPRAVVYRPRQAIRLCAWAGAPPMAGTCGFRLARGCTR